MMGISRLNSVFLLKGWAKKRSKLKVLGNKRKVSSINSMKISLKSHSLLVTL